ncbi:DUF2244 domain-containing protein [Roseomonas terrae]|jgi:uncharacterized membrane protein|uniref:DUF2244 domain-containing protein n=1 Tax=Neoroseomonas terrae TaxID=424799 RepID=A0ABS5EDP5_9PROT|nr:DUF2244 domain-containing protein [Neoroseomonas terrae]MBR0649124.1 DUF2244 domain-containing protein [Neoroseomonas terrae]
MAPPADPVLFQAICTPPRSFSRGLFRVLAGLLAVLATLTATVFLIIGAWPVLPFLGLEVCFALGMVVFHARRTARISEIILLTADRLTVTRTDARGRREEVMLDPYWARSIYIPRPAHAGVLRLESRGRGAEIGQHLGGDEKVSLHEALSAALARAKQPVFDNPQLR